MRVAFVGAGDVSVETAKGLIKNGHSVIMVDVSKTRLDSLLDHLDCSFLLGDGTRPDILRELNPEDTEILFCLTNNDQVNILTSLVAESLGFKRIITSIADAEFESVCHEVGVKNVIIPIRTISRYLQDIVAGTESVEMSTVLKDDARFFSFILEKDLDDITELGLPDDAKVVCFYHENKFFLAEADSKLAEGDEVVILTHNRNLPKLRERW